VRIIDKYLVRQFVQTFVVCFVSLTGLYIVIDAFGHLDELLAEAGEAGGLLSLVVTYYGFRSILFFDQISSILALISAMVTITWIQRHQEMTALQAAGIPKRRVSLPVIVCAMAVSIVAASNREALIPRIRSQLVRDTHNLSQDAGLDVTPRFDNASGIFLDGAQIFVEQQRIANPKFRLPPSLRTVSKYLAGGDAIFLEATADHPRGYRIDRVDQPENLASQESVMVNDRVVILTPHDHPWLREDQCFVASDVRVEMLIRGTPWQQFSSTAELVRGLASPSLDFGADVRVTIHSRMVRPFLDGTLIFLGLPLVLTSRNRNAFVAISLCLLLVVFFLLILLACRYMGSASLLRPVLAAWLPLFIFVPAAVYLSEPLRQ